MEVKIRAKEVEIYYPLEHYYISFYAGTDEEDNPPYLIFAEWFRDRRTGRWNGFIHGNKIKI